MEDFRQLVDTFYVRVYNFFRRRHVADPQAEELTQEVFLRVYKERASCRSEDPTAWIFAIARNIWRNHLREQEANKRRPPAIGDLWLHAQSTDLEPIDRLIDEERKQWLRKALLELPPQRQRCLKLRIQGRSIAEIGEIMGISTNTVKPTLDQARKQLRQLLEKAREEDGRDDE